MALRSLNHILSVTLGLLLLTALYISRRPPCIDSMSVLKIDRVLLEETETAWTCAASQDTKISNEFADLILEIQRRLAPLEALVARADGGVPHRLQLKINEEATNTFELRKGVLSLSGDLVRKDMVLERAYVKSWVLSKNPKLPAVGAQAEFLTELFMVAAGYENRAQLELDEHNEFGWPQAMKDVEGYCASEFKLAEHLQTCHRDRASLYNRALELSSYQFLFSSLRKVWALLPTKQKVLVFKNFARVTVAAQPMIVDGDESRIQAAVEGIRTFEAWLWKDSYTTPGFADLSKRLIQHIRGQGFKEDENKIQLDVVVISDLPLEKNAPFLNQLRETAQAEGALKIAVKDPNQLLLLPGTQKLRIENIEDFVADRVAVLKCGRFDFNWIFQFEKFTERLFVVDVCGSKKPDIRSWIAHGAEEFAADNKKFKFVQFHLPSLLFKKGELDRSTDVLSLLQKRDISDHSFRTLGWQEIEWSESADAYHPRAQIDAIDWFRLN